LTDIVEGNVETKDAVNALKDLYYTDYRKKGALNPKQEFSKTKAEAEFGKLEKFQNRFSRK
jgi:hypothetical protein